MKTKIKKWFKRKYKSEITDSDTYRLVRMNSEILFRKPLRK